MNPFKDNPNAQRFTHCPGCGKKDLIPDSIKSFACRACGFSFFLNCAAAAMALIFNEQGQVLVTRRKFDPGKGSLDFPGGFAEPGEGIEDCLVREVKEELDLTVTNLTYLASFANTYPYESIVYPVTDMAFVCQVKSLNPLAPGDDVAGVFFAALADLDPSQFAMASAAKVVKQIQSRAPVRLPGPNPLG